MPRRGEITSPPVRTPEERNALIADHYRLVPYTVNRLLSYPPVRRLGEELAMDAGYDGLIWAGDRYRPERGAKFSTFAVRCIRGYVLNVARAAPNRKRVWAGSLPENLLVGAVARRGLATVPARTGDAHATADQRELLARLWTLAAKLQERQRRVLRWRFHEGWLLDAIASELGVTKERVRQIEDDALARLFLLARARKVV